ncbi:protein disulfide isomerase pTAC5, chloroplastic [Rutidosis leptorrhynchoides]|uniref:protein disulfide isomerase pTAC5, chloroplastic n=1 Tax=Rutidosis leptorrhynchoides TaxID=125765 RepID=UPI003A99AD5E
MSSSIPLISFNTLQHSWHKSSPSHFNNSIFTFTKHNSISLSKSHICFTFNPNSSNYDREETRWLREEQRWLREEQRWIREQQRWENERELLLNQINDLKQQLDEIRHEMDNSNNNNSVTNVTNLLHVLKKEVSQIGERGSSASPLVVEAAAIEEVAAAVEDIEEVVKEVVTVSEEIKADNKVKKKKKNVTMLRVGSEGDQVQMLQEALLKEGFYCGEEDEEFSSFSTGTERAVKTWQSSIGVPETGVMTVELLERLIGDEQEETSGSKEEGNGVAATSVTKIPDIPSETVNEDPKAYVSDNRVFLLGENRYEDSSRLKNRNSQNQTDSKGVVTTKCITCRGEGRLLCLECDGTGEPNIEPQFLEWVGEETKCPYCEGHGHINCDVCQGTGVGVTITRLSHT